MKSDLKARSKIDMETLWAGYRGHRPDDTKKFLGLLLGLLFLLVALYGILSEGDWDLVFRSTSFPILTGLLLFAALAGLIARASADDTVRREMRNTPGFGMMAEWTFNGEGYTMATPVGEFAIAWPHVLETLIADDGVLVYRQPEAYHWVPRGAFEREADFRRFLSLVTAKTRHSEST